MSLVRIAVDADNLLARQFAELERQSLPFAIMQAVNATAFEIRQRWKVAAGKVFDRPTNLTRNAAQYRKATKERLFAEIFLRDEAAKGNPPAKYLRSEVDGGDRRKKAFEVLLQQKGVMPAGQFAVAGRGAKLDGYGNVRAAEVTKILSQLGAQRDAYQNQSNASARRRASRRRRGGEYFAITKQRGRLRPGIYERISSGFGGAVRSIFIYTSRATYRPRYDIFGLAQRQWNTLMPFYFNRELAKAMASSKFGVRR